MSRGFESHTLRQMCLIRTPSKRKFGRGSHVLAVVGGLHAKQHRRRVPAAFWAIPPLPDGHEYAVGSRCCQRVLLLHRHGENGDLSRFDPERCVARQETGEQVLHLSVLDRTVHADEQLLEQPLVEKPPLRRDGIRILLVAEPSDFKSPFKLVVQLVESLLGRCDLVLGGVYLAGDPIHLALQDVERNGTGVVSFHESGLLVLQGYMSSSSFAECEAGVGLAVR